MLVSAYVSLDLLSSARNETRNSTVLYR